MNWVGIFTLWIAANIAVVIAAYIIGRRRDKRRLRQITNVLPHGPSKATTEGT